MLVFYLQADAHNVLDGCSFRRQEDDALESPDGSLLNAVKAAFGTGGLGVDHIL